MKVLASVMTLHRSLFQHFVVRPFLRHRCPRIPLSLCIAEKLYGSAAAEVTGIECSTSTVVKSTQVVFIRSRSSSLSSLMSTLVMLSPSVN